MPVIFNSWRWICVFFIILRIQRVVPQKCSALNGSNRSVICRNISSLFEVDKEVQTSWRELRVENNADTIFTLSDLPVTSFDGIENLDLSDAGTVRAKTLQGLPSLRCLNISNGDIIELPYDLLGVNNKVEVINASRNTLKYLTPMFRERLVKLKYADFSYNEITTLDGGECEKLPLLEHLNLNNNEFRELNIGWCRQLKYLSLNDNLIKVVLNDSLTMMPKLEFLSIAANYITNVSPRAFATLLRLHTLNLSANSLENLDVEVFASEHTKIPLQNLDLNSNNLISLAAHQFQHIPQLRYLDLSRNSLITISPSAFHDLPNLELLDLHNNDIEELSKNTFNNLPVLESINLSGNNIVRLNANIFVELPRLNWLSLDNNHITSMPTLAGLPSLQFLSLAHNELHSLDDNVFASLNRLRFLNLNFNMLTAISEPLLESLNNLNELLIMQNRLTHLPEVDTTFPQLRRVALEGNPWQCPCLKFLMDWFHFKNISYLNSSSAFYKGEKPLCFLTPLEKCTHSADAFSDEELDKYLSLI